MVLGGGAAVLIIANCVGNKLFKSEPFFVKQHIYSELELCDITAKSSFLHNHSL